MERNLAENFQRLFRAIAKASTIVIALLATYIHASIKGFSIYTLSDLGVLTNLIGSLSLANEHYSPPTE